MLMLSKHFITLQLITCFARCLVPTSLPSIRLALIADTHSSTNWTKVFQKALELHNNTPHLQQRVIFDLISFYKNVRSFGDILDILCDDLLSQRFHAVFLSTESSAAYEFTQFVGLLPVFVLGTNRDAVLKTQNVLKNYKYLGPLLTSRAEVIHGILDSLEVHKYAVLRDAYETSQELAKEVISRHKLNTDNVLDVVIPFKDIYYGSAKILVMEEMLKIKIQGIKVIFLACREKLVKAVFDIASELKMASENFLWIGTESVAHGINNTAEDTPIVNFIGIKTSTSDKTIALRALQSLSSEVAENGLPDLPLKNASCSGNSNWTPSKKLSRYRGQAKLSSFFYQQIPETYDILMLENTKSLNKRSWRRIGARQSNETNEIKDNILQQTFKHILHTSSEKLIIVSIEHGQYLYKVGNVIGCAKAKRCTRKSLQRRSLHPACEIGVVCYEHANGLDNITDDMDVFCVSGLMIDLLGLIQNALHFFYELYLVPDGKYGAIDDTTGRWNGMIGEVLYGKADMALGTVTINAQRSRVVDFTTPYHDVGIGMMIYNGNSARPLITMEFLEPFGTSLWIAIVTTIFTILIALWFLDRKTKEFHAKNMHLLLRRKIRSYKKKQSVSLLESMSYTWSTFVHVPAGSGFPRSLSARLVAIFFAFAMIILSSTYTANLAANKVKDETETPIKGILDEKMIHPPPGFRYGTLKSSSTEAYFKFHRDSRMRKIYQNMKHYNVDDMLDGVEKVKSGEFSVYIDDVPYLEHLVSSQHDCSLRIVGKPFGISGYGLVLGKNSSWTQAISNSILKFSDDNILAELWSKWLVRKCLRKEDFEATPDRLSIYNFNGVFVFVAAGILISVVFSYFERKVAVYQARTQEKKKQELEEKNDSTNYNLTGYFVEKFPCESTLSNGATVNNIKNLLELHFGAANSTLQLEKYKDKQEKTLRFNSVC